MIRKILHSKWSWLALGAAGMLVVCLLVFAAVRTRSHAGDATTDVRQVEAMVGRHMLLPRDETPALATVTDARKLGNNKFLSEGHNGDKILIYAKWQRAILYRPSADRIVDVGPVDVSPPSGDANGFSPLGSGKP